MNKDFEEKMRQENLNMISNPATWHRYPILPIKRVNKSGGMPEFGLLLADNKPVVYMVNMWDLGDMEIKSTADIINKVKSTVYTSFEAILNDGWVVD